MRHDEFQNMTDEELASLSRKGDADAQETIIERYKAMVRGIAKSYYIAGGDNDDVVQEGMIGLFKATTRYDENREASFKTFAVACITSQIMTAVKNASRKKHQPLNEYISIDCRPENDDAGHPEMTYGEMIRASDENQPESEVIYNEAAKDISENEHGMFSEMELRVLREKMNGYEYDEIAAHLGKAEKQIDNALQRIKKKIIAYLEN